MKSWEDRTSGPERRQAFPIFQPKPLATRSSVSAIITTVVTHAMALNDAAVDRVPHERLPIHEQQHEDEHERKRNAVGDLRQEHDPDQRETAEASTTAAPSTIMAV